MTMERVDQDVIDEAMGAFFGVLAKRHPESISKDFPLEAEVRFTEACRCAAETWVRYNLPKFRDNPSFYRVQRVDVCPECHGMGYVQHPEWKRYIEAQEAGVTDKTPEQWFNERGYDQVPEDNMVCGGCGGRCEIVRNVSLEEAANALINESVREKAISSLMEGIALKVEWGGNTSTGCTKSGGIWTATDNA